MAKNNITILAEGNKLLDELSNKLVGVNTNLLEISKAARSADLKDYFNAKSPNDVNEKLKSQKTIIEQLNAQVKERNRLEKALNNQIAKNTLAESELAQELAKQRVETQLLNKQIKDSAKLSSSLVPVIQKTAILREREARVIKDLTVKKALGNKLSQKEVLTLKKSEAQFLRYDKAIRKSRESVGQFNDSIGHYQKGMSGAIGTARNLAGAMGLVGGSFLVVSVARDAIKVIKDFEKSNATLSSVLQVERKEMQGLVEDSQRLGSTTVKTAGQVTELQIAYARLGFSQKEILDLTESTISGSIAMNSELSATANLVGAVVNTFDAFSATDAPKIIDVLSLSTAKSALNFQKLETGIPIVAGAANAAGIPFTKLLALMGKLSDSGIDVSTSSTALRNIFIEAAADGDDYAEILETIKGSQDKLTASNDEFGKRAAVSATVLAQNIDATKELDEALKNAAGTAQSMADKELDTLDGSLKLLRSAWEGVILETDDANGVSSKLKDTIKALADNLGGILSTLFQVTKLYVIYKVSLFAINAASSAWASINGAVRLSLVFLNGGIKGVIASLRAMKLATAATGIGLFLVALGSAYEIWQSFKDGASDAADELSKFNDEIDRLKGLEDRFESALNNVAKGQERANAAVAEQFNLQEKLSKILEKEGATASFRQETIKKLSNLRGLDAEAAKKYAEEEFIGYSELGRKKIANFIVVSNKLNSIIDDNLKLSTQKGGGEIEASAKKGIAAIRGSIRFLENEIKLLEEKRSKLATNSEQFLTYEKAIRKSKEELSNFKEELQRVLIELDGLDSISTGESTSEATSNILKELARDKNPTIEGLTTSGADDGLEQLANDLKNKQDIELEIARETSDLKRQLEQDLAASLMDITTSVFDAKIMRYDEDIQRNNDYYASILDNQNLSEEQRDALEAERDRKNTIIEKKKRETQRKAAVLAKIIALSEIAVDTAKKVAAITATAAVLAANPLTAPLAVNALAQIPFAIGAGALAAAVIAARPIPKYKDGKEKGQGKDGIALLNDGGKDELKISDSGHIERITGRNVLAPVLKSDTIIPDADKFLSNLSDKELYENLHRHTILSSIAHQKETIDSYLIAQSMGKAYEKQTNRMIKAMEKNRPKINVHNNNSIGDDIAFQLALNKL